MKVGIILICYESNISDNIVVMNDGKIDLIIWNKV